MSGGCIKYEKLGISNRDSLKINSFTYKYNEYIIQRLDVVE